MTSQVRTVEGRRQLEPAHGPLLIAVGVFDGLHRGHTYLIDRLVHEARNRSARPAVVTFDAHPDAVLLGKAPPLLMDPTERLERLAEMGVEVAVIEHFDDELRRTPYDVFIRGITDRTTLAGFVMTPDAAFGHERAGTPDTLSELGRREGFEVIVVPPFSLDGREIRSSDIRTAIGSGDFDAAEMLLGRPYGMRGAIRDGVLLVAMPVVLPPPGEYAGRIDGRPCRLEVDDGVVCVPNHPDTERAQVEWGRGPT